MCVCVAVSVLLVEYVCTEVVSTAGSEGFLVSEVKSCGDDVAVDASFCSWLLTVLLAGAIDYAAPGPFVK